MAWHAVAAIVGTAVLFAIYALAARMAAARLGPVGRVVAQKLIGFAVLGGGAVAGALLLLPVRLDGFGAVLGPDPARSFLWIAGFLALIVPGTAIVSRRPESYARYPEIRIPVWSPLTVAASSVAWALYLLGYEALFRGFLLFGCVLAMPVPWAVAVSVLVYAAAHFGKGRREALGSIPVGILFCLATIDTGSIAAAFAGHFLLAQFNDYFALAANPAMRVAFGARRQ